jgi:hypothetical protein
MRERGRKIKGLSLLLKHKCVAWRARREKIFVESKSASKRENPQELVYMGLNRREYKLTIERKY